MLRFNPRLVRSCVAFADDSPLMQGLDDNCHDIEDRFYCQDIVDKRSLTIE